MNDAKEENLGKRGPKKVVMVQAGEKGNSDVIFFFFLVPMELLVPRPATSLFSSHLQHTVLDRNPGQMCADAQTRCLAVGSLFWLHCYVS